MHIHAVNTVQYFSGAITIFPYYFLLFFFQKWNVSSLHMAMWYRSSEKGGIFNLFFSELLPTVIIVPEDGRSMKNPLSVRLCRVAVFSTWKSQLCVWVYLLKCIKKQSLLLKAVILFLCISSTAFQRPRYH